MLKHKLEMKVPFYPIEIQSPIHCRSKFHDLKSSKTANYKNSCGRLGINLSENKSSFKEITCSKKFSAITQTYANGINFERI